MVKFGERICSYTEGSLIKAYKGVNLLLFFMFFFNVGGPFHIIRKSLYQTPLLIRPPKDKHRRVCTKEINLFCMNITLYGQFSHFIHTVKLGEDGAPG